MACRACGLGMAAGPGVAYRSGSLGLTPPPPVPVTRTVPVAPTPPAVIANSCNNATAALMREASNQFLRLFDQAYAARQVCFPKNLSGLGMATGPGSAYRSGSLGAVMDQCKKNSAQAEALKKQLLQALEQQAKAGAKVKDLTLAAQKSAQLASECRTVLPATAARPRVVAVRGLGESPLIDADLILGLAIGAGFIWFLTSPGRKAGATT